MKMAKNAVMIAANTKSSFTSFVCARLGGDRLLPLIVVLLLAFPGLARADTGNRTHAVTTVVVGIISYARWPSEPKPIRLCVTAPTQYAEGLFDPILLSAPGQSKPSECPLTALC